MCTDESLSWWDRDVDSEGKPIRADVRSAARDLWDYACEQARTFLGDASEAPELMETSVLQVSHYLDRRAAPLFERDAGALLVCAFYRGLRRHLSKLRRLELTADVATLPPPRPGRSCPSKEDCRLDAERVLRKLSDRARQMFEFRKRGYDWEEVAAILNTSDGAARAEYSRELKRLKMKLANKGCQKTESPGPQDDAFPTGTR
jgi:DNA-directed RNA polymerase specialized sigma24 family protein